MSVDTDVLGKTKRRFYISVRSLADNWYASANYLEELQEEAERNIAANATASSLESLVRKE